MAARTALTSQTLTLDGKTIRSAGATPDVSNGNTVASPGPYNCLIEVNCAGASTTLTVRAGGSGVTASGAAATGYQPWASASTGDLSVVCGGTATTLVGPFTSDRFTQNDGSLSLDWTSSTSVTVYVYTLPYVVA